MPVVAKSMERWRASARERRLYGGATVTKFAVYDTSEPENVKYIIGYGKTPGERKSYAIAQWNVALTARRNPGGFYYAPAPGMRGILVDITMDYHGAINLEPRNEKVKAQMRVHNSEWRGFPYDTVFLQEGREASEFEQHLTAKELSEISSGWTVAKKFDPWMFGHLVGYDFHEVIEP